jgi:hypothetical protein
MSETTVQDSSPTVADPSPAPESQPAPADQTNLAPDAPSSSADRTSPPSGDKPQSDREGLLAAVRSVLQPKQDGDTPPVPGEDTDVAGKTGTQTGDPAPVPPTQAQSQSPTQPDPLSADPSEAELKRLKPETRRRVERLLQQRDEARTALTSVEPELAQHRQLTGYLREHQLAADDVNMLLGVGASLRRGDFQSFLTGVMPYVQAAQEALGLRLPPDLAQQVEDGTISENAARELTKTRHRAVQAESIVRQQSAEQGQAETERRVTAVRTTIDEWEAETRRKDPDYPVKAAAVRRIGQALLQERGAPQSPAEARQLVQAAYDEATTLLLRARPAPQPTRRSPSGSHGTPAPALEPKSMKEAAVMALENMRRAS